ncbi:ribosome maturation factor RimM [Mycetocola miduiensis]|uniref:Ribosome maturation factor RimM n=1 Tax=Mycetocola miduiensis TaxID=995034 RepID=A0A1I4ZQX2_9MICO|nr:ribosome maturation factor RimM [Mycetocola miduiensis]SFN52453.1 16S rRNA processing protein RimM [Mycetocola miduiensis]
MNAAETPRTQLRVGRLTKAHGLKGAIKLELFTDDPARRFVPGAVFTLQVPTGSPWHGKSLTLTELRWYNGHPVGFFEGVSDRTQAETLVKAILWIEQDSAEASLEEDAWYDHQLVGLAVHRDGEKVGTVARVDHFPAQDLLIVATATGEVMVPFVKAIVPAVDVKAGIVTVTPPAGLFEELTDEEDDETDAAASALPVDTEHADSPTDDSAPKSDADSAS